MWEVAQQQPQTQPQTPPQQQLPVEQRRQAVYRAAAEVFQRDPDWVTYFREVLGVNGIVRKYFGEPEELLAFEQSEEYQKIQQMVASLRARNGSQATDQEPTRVITVRLPKSLHESLRTEAHERHTSMNKLCISKLLQMIDNGLIPNE